MKLIELLNKRQSDRKFTAEPVAKEDIVKCLEAARLSPSGCNSQPWKFVVITETEKVKALGDAAATLGMNRFAPAVPMFVAVVMEEMNFAARMGSFVKRKDFCMVDLGIAVENFCLQAAEIGLGTCVMGWFDERKIQQTIRCPKGKRIPLIIAMGHPDNPTRKKIRKSLEEMSSWNEY